MAFRRAGERRDVARSDGQARVKAALSTTLVGGRVHVTSGSRISASASALASVYSALSRRAAQHQLRISAASRGPGQSRSEAIQSAQAAADQHLGSGRRQRRCGPVARGRSLVTGARAIAARAFRTRLRASSAFATCSKARSSATKIRCGSTRNLSTQRTHLGRPFRGRRGQPVQAAGSGRRPARQHIGL